MLCCALAAAQPDQIKAKRSTELYHNVSQVRGTFWLTQLAREGKFAPVRADALDLLARLASPAAPATARMLLHAWPDGAQLAVEVKLLDRTFRTFTK